MIEAYFLKVDPLLFSEQSHLFSYLSKEKRRKMKSYRHELDALQTVYGELLIRSVLVKKFNLHNNEIEFSKNEYGKPFLKGLEPVSYNLSHSGEWVATAVSNQNIGIDIEKMTNEVDPKLILPYCSETEKKHYYALDRSYKRDCFYNLWTTKESFVKYKGLGIYYPLEKVESTIDGFVKGINHDTAWANRFIWDNNYQVSICTEEKLKLHVERVELRNINNLLAGTMF